LGFENWLEVARRGHSHTTLCLGVGIEVDEPPSAESAPGFYVVTFDPVVDDIGADAEDSGDLTHCQLMSCLLLG
jgi:hypothetical protein